MYINKSCYLNHTGQTAAKETDVNSKYEPIHLKEEQIAKQGKPYTLHCTVAPDEDDVDIKPFVPPKPTKHVIVVDSDNEQDEQERKRFRGKVSSKEVVVLSD